jgi:hypothetical protein
MLLLPALLVSSPIEQFCAMLFGFSFASPPAQYCPLGHVTHMLAALKAKPGWQSADGIQQ